MLIKTFTKDKLSVKIYDSRAHMGLAAAEEAAAKMRELLKTKAEINAIFAAAPSQNEMLAALVSQNSIDWSRVNAFHMDEYVGLAGSDSRSFSYFLVNRIFSLLPFHSVNLIDGTADPEKEAARYSRLLEKFPTDIVCMGIGENGHIAFNDPPVADFSDPLMVKKAELDPACRTQQVNDGCFESLDKVPKYALTLTVPSLVKAKYLVCTVPAKTKERAVYHTLSDEISECCPATVMRRHAHAVLFCDSDSGVAFI